MGKAPLRQGSLFRFTRFLTRFSPRSGSRFCSTDFKEKGDTRWSVSLFWELSELSELFELFDGSELLARFGEFPWFVHHAEERISIDVLIRFEQRFDIQPATSCHYILDG